MGECVRKGLGPKLGSFKEKMLYWERDIRVEIEEFGSKMGFKGSGQRKVLLGRVWAKMGLLKKMGVGKGHLSRNKGFWAKWGSLGKVGVRKGLLGRKEGV